MIKSVIFDLDGTLIDSMYVWYDTDKKFLEENGIANPPEDVSESVKAMTIDEASDYFIECFGLKLDRDYVTDRIEEIARKEYAENVELKPYVREFLDFLDSRNIPYCIATATYINLAEAVLKRHGILDRFGFIFTDREYPRGKNFADIYFGCAEKMGTSPDETLVIEDALHCIQTASGAGFKTAGVYDRHSEPDRDSIISIADYYFDSLDELIRRWDFL